MRCRSAKAGAGPYQLGPFKIGYNAKLSKFCILKTDPVKVARYRKRVANGINFGIPVPKLGKNFISLTRNTPFLQFLGTWETGPSFAALSLSCTFVMSFYLQITQTDRINNSGLVSIQMTQKFHGNGRMEVRLIIFHGLIVIHHYP